MVTIDNSPLFAKIKQSTKVNAAPIAAIMAAAAEMPIAISFIIFIV